MSSTIRYIIGTSGYSFDDWVGNFYPPGTRQKDMFACYVERFETVELNFTFYNLQPGRTLQRLATISPPGFCFWVKANQELTHKGNISAAEEFKDNLQPMQESEKLAGVLLQFPQSFRRTDLGRKYLSEVLEALSGPPLAVEFRHHSWDHPSVLAGLRERDVTVVIPDVPVLEGLYRPAPAATTPTAYLRLHSRSAEGWYGGMAARYDYSYSDDELRSLLEQWNRLEGQVERAYVFLNNCHRGQAAHNAESLRRILGQIPGA
jgi:uncharacterized protein YecE (DUF72 family)